MDIKEKAVKEHLNWQGKIEIVSRVKLQDKDDLSVAYTPGVAQPCLEIEKNPDLSYSMTRRGNLVGDHRWNRGAGFGRYRTFGGNAGYGGEMRTV